MSNTIKYKGYVGSVEISEEDHTFTGKVLGLKKSLIMYEGKTLQELTEDFCGSIDDYLEYCNADGIEPEKPYKGSFNVRIGSDLHRSAAIYAMEHNQSLNSFVEDAIRQKLACM